MHYSHHVQLIDWAQIFQFEFAIIFGTIAGFLVLGLVGLALQMWKDNHKKGKRK